MFHIESLLSARLFISPQVTEKRIYFISNLSGKLSLYAMSFGGSVPEPLLPPNIALQNPHLIGGLPFVAFPELSKIFLMMDRDGDENYLPMVIPLEGGFPEPAFNGFFEGDRVHLMDYDRGEGLVTLSVESNKEPVQTSYLGNLKTGSLTKLAFSAYGALPTSYSSDYKKVLISDSYMMGDTVLYQLTIGEEALTLLQGKPLGMREEGETYALNGIGWAGYSPSGKGVLMLCAIFSDAYGPAYFELDHPDRVLSVQVEGISHQGMGEMTEIRPLHGNRYLVVYNIDGCSWAYEAAFDEEQLSLKLEYGLVGNEPLSMGMLESISYEKDFDQYALSFSTATSPTQIYTLAGKGRDHLVRHTSEKVLGIPQKYLSAGEDISFISFDATRISARLYLPNSELGFTGKRPLVYYIHGGPQSQERPDFAWFSMPLIQYLTLNGFAVFVPNVRGSTGYGLNYTKQVDRDWGGQDRLDHIHAMELLAKDPRIDTKRAGVVGRSYGGYMTLTLAGRHTELWKSAVDMFGPFDLLTFLERIPETWKPYFALALGDPEKDREFLEERSPKTYLDLLACPMLVIQGKNDPRVVAAESQDLVEHLRSIGKHIEYLLFENEGHDVLKYENRLRCYNAITEFFKSTLQP
jgi:pimeloyl-ACP methyl ester carboxylesterase